MPFQKLHADKFLSQNGNYVLKHQSLALSAHHRRPIFKARCKFCRKPDFLPSAPENFLHRANFANRLLASNEVRDLLDMHFVVL